jgi:hypothetical protein
MVEHINYLPFVFAILYYLIVMSLLTSHVINVLGLTSALAV